MKPPFPPVSAGSPISPDTKEQVDAYILSTHLSPFCKDLFGTKVAPHIKPTFRIALEGMRQNLCIREALHIGMPIPVTVAEHKYLDYLGAEIP